MPRRHLPVVGQTPEPEGDPLELLRRGKFAWAFALIVTVIGLVWIGSHHVQARTTDDAQVLVHSELADSSVAKLAFAAPPKPPVEDITPSKAPPMPEVEDITPGEAPPMPAVEDITPDEGGEEEFTIDRFGRKRTKSGALILDEGGEDPDVGLDGKTKEVLSEGGFFDPTAFDDAKTVKKKAYVHLMPGIPNEVFFASGAVILLLSFVVFERYGKEKNPRRHTRSYWRKELT